ncbi:MAG: hydrolase [Magnetospirillum sp.]|nr:hydrolase [Magnetospirillum sp.]
MLLESSKSALLIVDIQQALLPAMARPDQVVRGAERLMRAALRLDVPVLVSEQYPKGLGATVPELRSLAPDGAVMEKLDFSCVADPSIRARLQALPRPQIVVAGIEAHVCVLQTAMQLRESGWSPFVVADATASRRDSDHQAALARLAATGVAVGSVEMVLFEWLRRAGTPEFKDVSKLIK